MWTKGRDVNNETNSQDKESANCGTRQNRSVCDISVFDRYL